MQQYSSAGLGAAGAEAREVEPIGNRHASNGLQLIVLGTGAGSTHVYHGECSSSFVLATALGEPVLLCDCGPGTVNACLREFGRLPDVVYVSHNHTDHAGELAVMLAMEANRGHRMRVISHPDIQNRLQRHRIHELKSTGRRLSYFGDWVVSPEDVETEVIPDFPLTLRPVRSRHAELCYGLVVTWEGRPVLGWSADSGWDTELYSKLSVADTLLLDARKQGTTEHAGFDQVASLAHHLNQEGKRLWITGYGRQCDAPDDKVDLCGALVARPRSRIPLV